MSAESTPRQCPTGRQIEVLLAYIAAGSIAGAAHNLGISESTARQHLSGLYWRTGCLNVAQAAYWLGSTVEISSGRDGAGTAATCSSPRCSPLVRVQRRLT